MHSSEPGETESVDPQQALLEAIPGLRNVPAGTQVCIIQEGGRLLLYNVNKAIELVQGREPTAVIDVAERARLTFPRGAEPPPEDRAVVDPAHADEVDLSYPVLLLETLDELDGTPGRLIDGWHRVYRAAQLGIATLPAVVITAEEEPLIRVMPQAEQE